MLDTAEVRVPNDRVRAIQTNADRSQRTERPRSPKLTQSRYKKDLEVAALRRAEQEKQQKAREAHEQERRAMAKAKRPTKDGKAKLGRQGTVLLSRIQRLTDEGKI
jgi:hypothetical protein